MTQPIDPDFDDVKDGDDIPAPDDKDLPTEGPGYGINEGDDDE